MIGADNFAYLKLILIVTNEITFTVFCTSVAWRKGIYIFSIEKLSQRAVQQKNVF